MIIIMLTSSFSAMKANSPLMYLTVATGARAKKALMCRAKDWLKVNPAKPIAVPCE